MTRGRFPGWTLLVALAAVIAVARPPAGAAPPEVRGTWLTTTANDHLATPDHTARTMHRLREIGLNTVYVEAWKNGYTQFPSADARARDRRRTAPRLIKAGSVRPGPSEAGPRPAAGETSSRRTENGLHYIAWFEYGFMAAHKDTDNHLRRMKPEWLSRDIERGTQSRPTGSSG